MANSDSRGKPIKVILPPEPPELTPAAARALLRVLVKAYERQQARDIVAKFRDLADVPARRRARR